MLKLGTAAVLAIAFAGASAVAAPAEAGRHRPSIGYSHDAGRVLAEARAAAGGNGWYMLRGWHETGHLGGVPYQRWLDPLRYGMRLEVHEPAGVRTEGFNGQGDWRIATPGAEPETADNTAVAEARAEAFFGVYGFFYAARFDAHGEAMGVRSAGGRSFDVVEVKPFGGPARQLWFDSRTHLLARMVDHSGPKPVTTELSDYRKVGPVHVAFRQTIETGDGPRIVRQIESLVFAPTDRAMFSLPRTEAPSRADASS